MKALRGIGGATFGMVLGALCSGCVIDVDLESSPDLANIGTPIRFDIGVTNRSVCPVGNVTAVLFPFIVKDSIINRIQDPELRELLRDFANALCSGQDPTLLSVGTSCELVTGDLICSLQRQTPGGTQERVALLSTDKGDEVTCEAAGSTVTCRIPKAILDMGAQAVATASTVGTLPCQQIDGIVVCFTLRLDPNETKAGGVEIAVDKSGTLRNFIIAAAGKDDGVCASGLIKGVPCDDDGDCLGPMPRCGEGMCIGGTRDGFGCDDVTYCPGGTECRACGTTNGDIFAGLACTETVVGTPTPTVSPWGLGAAAILLTGIGCLSLRYRQRQRRHTVS